MQAGLAEGGDVAAVATLSGLPAAHILPEAWRLTTPCSPHRAAEIDGVVIEPDRLEPPNMRPLVIEGAGGAMVPLTSDTLVADLIARWRLPTVIVARTTLGTINHSLLTVEALRKREVPILGIAFVGEAMEDCEATIARLSGVKRLGRLPHLRPLNHDALAAAFAAQFRLEDFL